MLARGLLSRASGLVELSLETHDRPKSLSPVLLTFHLLKLEL